MATKPPTQTLEVTELNEVSLVEAGDNPDAGVCLMKRRPHSPPSPTEKPMPDGTPNDEIAKLREEQAAEKARNAELEKRLAAFEKANEIATIEKRIGANLADLAADIYEIGKSAPDAAKRIEERLLKLERQASQVEKLTRPVGGAGAQVPDDNSIEARVEKVAQDLIKNGKHTSIHSARAAAITIIERGN